MYNSKQHKIRLGFKEDDNNKILFESQEVYLSNMSFFNKLFKAYDLLEEGELSAAKDYLQVIVKSHPDNYKSRFILEQRYSESEVDEIKMLKKRIRLSGLSQDLSTEKLICDEYNFIYVLTPKVATRSLMKLFRNSPMGKGIRITSKPLISLLNENQKYRSYFKFGFVRNPYQRILSCYKDKILTTTLKNDESENATPENEWLRFKISKYNLNYGMTFDDFVNFLCSEHGSDMIGERHWISQYALMTDIEDRLLLDYVGKLESLEADWKHICQQIEIPFSPLERKNNTQQKITKLNPIKYTKDTVEKIKVRYRKDFEIFDYSKEYAT